MGSFSPKVVQMYKVLYLFPYVWTFWSPSEADSGFGLELPVGLGLGFEES